MASTIATTMTTSVSTSMATSVSTSMAETSSMAMTKISLFYHSLHLFLLFSIYLIHKVR